MLRVVLTLTVQVSTALAVACEIERATMETLLALPVRPIEVMLGEIVLRIFAGFVLTGLMLLAACFVFGVPARGSSARRAR